jgi:MFS transporter, OFA family, oxalate/formate antiporter
MKNQPIVFSRWRYVSVVLGVAIGLSCSFTTLFNASLPFFLVPLGTEFGWGRGDTSAAAVMSMLGVTLASPFVGRLFDRFGPEKVIFLAVLLFSAGTFSMSKLSASLYLLGTLCFVIGLVGSATTMVGYISVLPRWFDQRLGLTLGLAGLGAGAGIGFIPFVASKLTTEFGWRGAYAALSCVALVAGILAYILLKPRAGETPPVLAKSVEKKEFASGASIEGFTIGQAIKDYRFWLMVFVTFIVPFSILGIALHGVALFTDRGLTAQQGAIGAAIAGLGAILARVGVGALLDRFHAPHVAAMVFIAAAAGLGLNSFATTLTLLCVGTFLGGATMGAEGDLLPYIVRRYFGMRAFGAIFGSLHSAYALGGVLGPIAFGYTFDHLRTYSAIMVPCAVLCVLCAVAVLAMGTYRFNAESAGIDAV